MEAFLLDIHVTTGLLSASDPSRPRHDFIIWKAGFRLVEWL